MQIISESTRISTLIKANPDVIEAIAGINAHFRKLNNPFLRKFLAPRVTIAEAAMIGSCKVDDFFEKLKPLGFVIDYGNTKAQPAPATAAILEEKHDVLLDVRADIAEGADPFKKIMAAVSALAVGEVLLLVNSFAPAPLIRILDKKGYKTMVVSISPDEIHTYIKRTTDAKLPTGKQDEQTNAFDDVAQQYAGRLTELNVRALPMPQPMIKILETLEQLPPGYALFVYHKKIPVYLLPELEERNFAHVVRQVPEGIELIIYPCKEDHDSA